MIGQFRRRRHLAAAASVLAIPVLVATVGPTLTAASAPLERADTASQSVQTAAARAEEDPDGADARAEKVVYLTLDDGPSATYTPQVLDLLRRNNAHATFFLLGNNASKNSKLVTAIRAGGHTVGNHTWDHPQLTKLSSTAVNNQLRRTEGVIGNVTCVRPPYGATNAKVNAVITGRGERVVMWSMDPQDWARPGATVIRDRVMSQVRPGSIILMHDGGGDRSQTVAALGQILPALAAKGYRVAPVPGC